MKEKDGDPSESIPREQALLDLPGAILEDPASKGVLLPEQELRQREQPFPSGICWKQSEAIAEHHASEGGG